jgi:hypothetical protein
VQAHSGRASTDQRDGAVQQSPPGTLVAGTAKQILDAAVANIAEVASVPWQGLGRSASLAATDDICRQRQRERIAKPGGRRCDTAGCDTPRWEAAFARLRCCTTVKNTCKSRSRKRRPTGSGESGEGNHAATRRAIDEQFPGAHGRQDGGHIGERQRGDAGAQRAVGAVACIRQHDTGREGLTRRRQAAVPPPGSDRSPARARRDRDR